MRRGDFGTGVDMDDFVRTAKANFSKLIGEGSYRGALVHVLSLMRKCKPESFQVNIL